MRGIDELVYIPLPWGVCAFYLARMMAEYGGADILRKRPDIRGRYTFGPLNKRLAHVASGIPVDLFSTTACNWGMSFLVRTGNRLFDIKAMSTLKKRGLQGHAYGGITDARGREIPCPTEEVVFQQVGWRYLSPENRR